MFKAFFTALLTYQQKQANNVAIAKHLAKIALYELKGEKALYPDVRKKFKLLEERMALVGKPILLQSDFRTAKKQNELYAQGRTKSGKIVTNARALESWHNVSFAFDCVFQKYYWSPPSQYWWDILGNEGEKLGLIWGGRWDLRDYGHFEHPITETINRKTLKEYFKNYD